MKVGMVCAAVASAAIFFGTAFAQSEEGPPPLPAFPLIGLWGPPATEDDFAMYRDAHFNIVPVTWGSGFDEAARLARRLRMPVMASNPTLAGGTPEAWAATFAQHDHIVGLHLADRLRIEELPRTVELIKEYRKLDAKRFILITLPPRDQQSRWGEMIAQLTQAGIPLLCYSRPAFFEDGATDENGYLQDLELTRRIAAQVKLPFWGIVYATKHERYRRAAESDLRFQAYANLAAGARGLCYFTYWGPGPKDVDAGGVFASWGMPMVDPATREPQYGYEKAAELNREILTLAPILLGLTSAGVYYAGQMPEGGKPIDAAASPLVSVTAEKAMIGLFSGKRGESWALIVNRRYGKQRSAFTQSSVIQATVAPSVRRVVEIDRVSACETDVPLSGGQFLATIPGGTGGLFRFDGESLH